MLTTHNDRESNASLVNNLSNIFFGKPTRKKPGQDNANAVTTTLALLMSSYLIPGANSDSVTASIKKYNDHHQGNLQLVNDYDDLGVCPANLSLNITHTEHQHNLAQQLPTLSQNAFPEMKHFADNKKHKSSKTVGGSELYDHNKYACYQIHHYDQNAQKTSDFELTFIRPETFTDKKNADFLYSLVNRMIKSCSFSFTQHYQDDLLNELNVFDLDQAKVCDSGNDAIQISAVQIKQYDHAFKPYLVTSFDLRQKTSEVDKATGKSCLEKSLKSLGNEFQRLQNEASIDKQRMIINVLSSLNLLVGIINAGVATYQLIDKCRNRQSSQHQLTHRPGH